MKYDPENGWILPPHDEWPEISAEMVEHAVALLLISGEVISLCATTHDQADVAGLYAACGDTFVWGCADAEPLPSIGYGDGDDEAVLELYNWVRADGSWGSTRWCCLRRGMRPQKPVETAMRAAGAWCERMEALPVRA